MITGKKYVLWKKKCLDGLLSMNISTTEAIFISFRAKAVHCIPYNQQSTVATTDDIQRGDSHFKFSHIAP